MNVDRFIQRMLVLFGAPESPDDAAFVEEYREMLEGTEGPVLKVAFDVLRDTHNRAGWPRPAEVRAACAKAGIALSPASQSKRPLLTETDFEWVGPEDVRYVKFLTAARTDAPAYAAMIERRGKIKVRKEAPGPKKAALHAVISDVSKRMTGERD
jgi:hypothetical protein